jgi:DNA invertase Pin-like site-specific DNA recombinase
MSGAHTLTRRHLDRLAIVYVRQSTLTQVREHTESTARQYALAEEAARLGWEAASIVTIDTDLGLSGRSASGRTGFKEVVSRVCVGEVGAIFGLEISRLARSSADLQRLLEFCSISDTLVVDADGIYDLRNFNDRLLLGLNRPDSYSTSYSSSRRSANSFEIHLTLDRISAKPHFIRVAM